MSCQTLPHPAIYIHMPPSHHPHGKQPNLPTWIQSAAEVAGKILGRDPTDPVTLITTGALLATAFWALLSLIAH